MCQTHYRQEREGDPNKPIRPYRRRRSGTRKLQGLSISIDCADAIEERAADSGQAPAAIIADVLEAWASHRRGQPSKPKPGRKALPLAKPRPLA